MTNGGYNATAIGLLPLATRILKPTAEGDDQIAKREAFLRPKVISEFLKKYNGSPMPKDDIAKNVLEDMGVPSDRTDLVLKLISDGAKQLGFLHEIKGRFYVELSGTSQAPQASTADNGNGNGSSPAAEVHHEFAAITSPAPPTQAHNRKVFITHGKNRAFVDPIRQLLAFGEMEAVVSVERQSVSQPVPDKVMDDMRSCAAAIIHVEDELRLIDHETKEHVMLNPNVLIEIGAAMALFRRRFILLVKDGVRLPSNLQGLFEVRYQGDSLDGNATIRLLAAINELKKMPSTRSE